MKRKRIINIRKCAATLALLTTTIIAGITNSSAAEANNVTNINNSKPETSSTIITDANQQRLAGGLIIDPTTLRPVASISDYFGKNQQWVSVNDVFEERLGPDGNITGRRNHDYKVIKIEEVTTKDGAVEEVKTAECQSCGHIMTLKKTIKEADHNHGTGGGSHGGGGSSSGGSGDNKPVHIHNWSSWTPINDTEHRRICLTEGCTIKTQTYKHTFGEWSDWSEWTLTTDAEGKQIEVRTRTQTCNDCGYVKSEKQTKPYNPEYNHSFGNWEYVDDNTERRTCTDTDCNEYEERGHSKDATLIDSSYEIVDENHHKKVDIKHCTTCNHDITITNEEVGCTFTYNKENGNEECICGNSHIHTNHNYKDTTRVEAISGDDKHHNVITESECTICGNKKSSAEVVSCTFTLNSDGTHNDCECGNAYQEVIECNHEHCTEISRGNPVSDNNKSTHSIIIKEKCDECGEEIEKTIHESCNPGVKATETNIDGYCQVTRSYCKTCNGLTYEDGTREHTPAEAESITGKSQCIICHIEVDVPKPSKPPKPTTSTSIDQIIDNQSQAMADANAAADKKLDDLINSGAADSEIDEALDKIINEQDQAISDANASADNQLEETILNIENESKEGTAPSQTPENEETKTSEIDSVITEPSEVENTIAETIEIGKIEAETVIESGNKEVEQVIEVGDKEVDEVMERSTAELQVRMEQADAELAAILASSPLKRIRKLF